MFLDLLDSFGCELFSLSVLHFLNNLSMFSCVFCIYRLEQKHSVLEDGEQKYLNCNLVKEKI